MAEPKRAIFSLDDLRAFRSSTTHTELTQFLAKLSHSIKGTPLPANSAVAPNFSLAVQTLLSVLTTLEGRIADFPPVQETTGRFGNRAFRPYLENLHETAAVLLSPLFPQARDENADADAENNNDSNNTVHPVAKELAPYLGDSFGNKTRLDYGTGHEANFLILLYCLFKAGALKTTASTSVEELTSLPPPQTTISAAMDDLHAVGLCVLPKYFALIRRLVSEYSLEPAGTHGAWSLDDYCFLPFLLGACQLTGNNAITPSHIKAPLAHVQSMANEWIFFTALSFIRSTKASVSFSQGSPMLHDIGGLPSWETISRGLSRMFEDEVLGKFPVAQHVVFGRFFPATWRENVSEGSNDAIPPPLSGLALLSMQARSPHTDVDPFMKYFNHLRGGSVGTRTFRHTTASAPPPRAAAEGANGFSPVTVLSTPSAGHGNSEQISFLPNNQGICLHHWQIRAHKSHLSNAQDLSRMTEELAGAVSSLPEMVFGSNLVEMLHHPSSTRVHLVVLDALRGCVLPTEQQGAVDGAFGVAPPRSAVRVPIAQKWESRSVEVPQMQVNHDWTYTTDYCGTFTRDNTAVHPVVQHTITHTNPTTTPAPAPPTLNPPSVDYELLKLREPIRWFEEVTLFESELDDFGCTKLSAKLRVMDSCFFALMRLSVRVDGVVVRVWDTRFFHKFGTAHIALELCRREMAHDELEAATKKSRATSFYNDAQNYVDFMPVVWQQWAHLPLQ